MEIRAIGKKKVKYALLFLFALLVFAIIRAPYRELKMSAVRSLAMRAGMEVSLAESRFILPLGIEIKDLIIKGNSPKGRFVSPRLEELSLRLKLSTLFSDSRLINFRIVSGGVGEGSALFGNDSLKLQLAAANISVAGLRYGDNFEVRRGRVSVNGNFDFESNHLTGDASVAASGNDLLVRGLSPLLPDISIDSISLKADKSGEKIKLGSIEADSEGLRLKGSGKVLLKGDLPGSRVDIKAKVDIRNGANGAFGTFLPFLGAFSARKGELELEVHGEARRPEVSVNGQKIL